MVYVTLFVSIRSSLLVGLQFQTASDLLSEGLSSSNPRHFAPWILDAHLSLDIMSVSYTHLTLPTILRV